MGRMAEAIRETRVATGALGIFWLGGAGFVLKTAQGKVVVIDPYLSDSLDRSYGWKRLPSSPVVLQAREVEADLVLTTHAHEDHLDPDSIPGIAEASQAIFVGPTTCVETMRAWGIPKERVMVLNRGEQRIIAGIPVSAVLAHHVSPAGAQTPDAVGYVLELEGTVIYHTGDSLYTADLGRVKERHPDILFVVINGQYGNMNPAEAARLTAELTPRRVIPMHWGLVAENTAEPCEFLSALGTLGSQAQPVIIAPGDLYVYTGV